MGRKRNQGKVRRVAKAKAKQEAEERDNQMTAREHAIEQLRTRQLQSRGENLLPTIGRDTAMQCTHSLDPLTSRDVAYQFVLAFSEAFCAARGSGNSLSEFLGTAHGATMVEFAEVWSDSTKLESAISYFLFSGTDAILDGNYDYARKLAFFARYFEQYIAVMLEETEPITCWPKVVETYYADMHTLVKFFRHRTPCSCLDEKYEEVKNTTKIGLCYNPECKFPDGRVERSKTMYCSRCRCAVYCSRECQEFDWTTHKRDCDGYAATKARFEAKKKS